MNDVLLALALAAIVWLVCRSDAKVVTRKDKNDDETPPTFI